jgi:transposase, IS5 family
MDKYTTIEPGSLFSDQEDYSHRWLIFQQSKLGQIYNAIPFQQLSMLLPYKSMDSVGAPPWFNKAGMFGVMFLKSYLGLSDEKLVERLNTDWELQMFCGRQFSDNQRIKDRNLPSRIRVYIGQNLSLEAFQDTVIENWKPYLKDTHCGLFDATAYESYIKFPTDEKLLWDCCVWVFESVFILCKELGMKRPRSKYREQERKQTAFSKTKKKTYKLKKRRRKSLLYLLNQGIGFLEEILTSYYLSIHPVVYSSIVDKLKTVKTIHYQQKYMHENPGEYVKDRIVSLFKPYLRPIVRGKENKRVEFGAKLHIYQVDGINIIDKLSFDPFNEAKNLKGCVIKHIQRFGKLHQLGVDNIYGTNENRKYLTGKEIYTCLPRKGKPSKHEKQLKQLRKELGKQRATVLEGSFGNEKNHYGLKKVKARTEKTEIVWILFGIMTANAVKISKKKQVA